MIGGRSVLAIIPARGGSKGVPGKNLIDLGGRPLIAWTIVAAQRSRFIDRVILSSDNEGIIAAARAAGCDAPFQRAALLGADEASSTDVVLDALNRVPGYDLFVLLQPTSPLRTAEDIDSTLARLEETGAESCVSVTEARDHPYLVYAADGRGRLSPFAASRGGQSLRRQDLPPAWVLNGAVYAASVEAFRTRRDFLGPDAVAYPMPADRSLDIDTLEDVEHARTVVARTEGAA